MITCPSCAAENVPQSSFCSACGSALPREYAATVTQPTSGERGARAGEPAQSSLSDSSTHGRFLPGTKFADRYRIVSLLGVGGMGEVYRADDLKLGHSVALKLLPPDLATDPRRHEYFHNEVRLSRQISHPNVCRVYDIGEADGQHFLSMEYIDGEDLKILLRRIGRLPKDKGVQIAQQLCAGLAAAHDRGVLHRDLKPANIMIDGRGHVRITDFGLAKLAEDGGDDEVAGTPTYMAPEQLIRGQTTIQSDLYSLGLILYELFTGRAVHKPSAVSELIKLHEESSPSPPSGLVEDMDPTVERVILHCLRKDPRARPKSAHAVATGLPGGDPLAAALAAGETPSPEMVAAAGENKPVDWRLALAAGAGITVLLLLNLWLADRTSLTSRSQLNYEPAILRHEIQEMLSEEFGYEGSPAHEIHGYSNLQKAKDGVLFYWHRQRPEGADFVTNSFWSSRWAKYSRARPDFFQPPWDVAKELGVALTGKKQLRYFRALPPIVVMTKGDPPRPRWSDWFTPERTGFYLPSDINDKPEGADLRGAQLLEIVEDRWRPPPDAFDTVGLWRGTDSNTGNTFWVEAAAFRGKPTYFNVIDDDDFNSPSQLRIVGEDSHFSLGTELSNGLYGIVLIAGVVLAWRNLQLGRGDRAGGRRLAGYVFVIHLVVLVAYARHSTSLDSEIGLVFTMGLAQAVFGTARAWVWYMALEPFVRRIWPQILISSSRLLDGRIGDPLVGRDLLAGTLFGSITILLFNLDHLLQEWLAAGELPWRNFFTPTLLGARELVGSAFAVQEAAIFFAFFILMMLLACRIALKTERRAIAACLILLSLTVASLWGGQPALTLLTAAIRCSLLLVLLVRFGILAVVVEFTTVFLFQAFPVTLDTSHWYFDRGMFAVVLLAGVVFFGFYASTRGSRSFVNAIDSSST